MQTATIDLTIAAGATFEYALRWFDSEAVHKPITAVAAGWPTVVTVAAHGITSRTPVWISNVRSPAGLNTPRPSGCAPWFAEAIDTDTLAVDVNTGASTAAYTGAGILTRYPAVDLTGYTARMQMRTAVGATDVLVDLTTENSGITLDAATGEITLSMSATDTAALAWRQAVYDLELVAPSGFVTRLAEGSVQVTPEVTRA